MSVQERTTGDEQQGSVASLSLDLDNAWSYMKTHGDPGWQQLPSYLDALVEVALPRLEHHGIRLTVFVVGQDAALDKNETALRQIAQAGHDIGNHSFSHEPWFQDYSADKSEEEIRLAEEHIERATGRRPRGYRGPGFSVTPDTLQILARRGYSYDASTFPTFLGPLARAYYFFNSGNLSPEERRQRRNLFGSVADGLADIRPYRWKLEQDQSLLEIPVTTMPLSRAPIHMSYLLYIGLRSPALALTYLRTAIALCKLRQVEPSFLLHPLDFLGGDMESRLGFFPAMAMPTAKKLELFDQVIELLSGSYRLVDMQTHAELLLASGNTRLRSVQ